MSAPRSMLVADRYELHELVGRGGCGMVFRASDREAGRTVAVKMLSPGARQDALLVERLLREQQALQALVGTHAVRVIDLCRAPNGSFCLVMEWLEGSDLEQRLTQLEAEGARMTCDELLGVLQPITDTLEKAHELGIVHRDIKPANIFILSGGRGVRLLDFGFSRLQSSATLTAMDTVMGSPSYIAPEAWQAGSKSTGRQADLYAAGVIVFRALTGRVPFEGSTLIETMRLVTQAERPSVCAFRPDLPGQVDEWMQYALAVDRARRFQYASAFYAALVAALDGLALPEHTKPVPFGKKTSVPPPRTTASQRENAFTTALRRASSLLKRVAASLAPEPKLDSEGVPALKAASPAPVAPAHPRRLPPPPQRLPKAPAQPGRLTSAETGTVTAGAKASENGAASAVSAPMVSTTSNGAGAPAHSSVSDDAEQDSLISDLLTPSEAPSEAAHAVQSPELKAGEARVAGAASDAEDRTHEGWSESAAQSLDVPTPNPALGTRVVVEETASDANGDDGSDRKRVPRRASEHGASKRKTKATRSQSTTRVADPGKAKVRAKKVRSERPAVRSERPAVRSERPAGSSAARARAKRSTRQIGVAKTTSGADRSEAAPRTAAKTPAEKRARTRSSSEKKTAPRRGRQGERSATAKKSAKRKVVADRSATKGAANKTSTQSRAKQAQRKGTVTKKRAGQKKVQAVERTTGTRKSAPKDGRSRTPSKTGDSGS